MDLKVEITASSRTSLRLLHLLPLLRQFRLVSGGGLVQFCLKDTLALDAKEMAKVRAVTEDFRDAVHRTAPFSFGLMEVLVLSEKLHQFTSSELYTSKLLLTELLMRSRKDNSAAGVSKSSNLGLMEMYIAEETETKMVEMSALNRLISVHVLHAAGTGSAN